jgi:anti-sigma factor ChrR (cupin superfamily)
MKQALILKNLLNIVELQEQLPWEHFREGVEIYQLYNDGQQGSAAALLRYQPGASVPKHDHQGFEHILILSGSQMDQNGIYEAGTLVINPPASHHSVTSATGCIVLAIWEKPISIWS